MVINQHATYVCVLSLKYFGYNANKNVSFLYLISTQS